MAIFFSFDASSSLVVRVMRDGFPPSHPFAILLRGGGGGGLYHNLTTYIMHIMKPSRWRAKLKGL